MPPSAARIFSQVNSVNCTVLFFAVKSFSTFCFCSYFHCKSMKFTTTYLLILQKVISET